MAKETEIKLRIDDKAELQRKLRALRAKITVPRTFEENILFDTDESELKKKEQLLRIRSESPAAGKGKRKSAKDRALLTFKSKSPEEGGNKGGSERHKTREELELEVSDGPSLEKIFQGLELREWFRYEKYRTTYQLKQPWAKKLKIEMDETPIGMFVELEGPEDAIDRTAEALGFAHSDYIVANYIEVYREHCRKQGEEPGQMVFADGKTQKKTKKVA